VGISQYVQFSYYGFRNNTDDVAVLRAELQNVQKIMVEDIGEKKEKQLDNVRADNDKLKEELLNFKSQSIATCKELSQKIKHLEDENGDLKEKFFHADAQSESLQVDVKTRQSNLDQLKQNLQEVTRGSDQKSNEIGHLKSEIASLQDVTKENLSSEQTKANSLEVKLETLQNRLSSQKARVSDLTDELATLQRHYDEQCHSNDEIKGHLGEVQSSLQESQRHKGNL
jgi:chromosome segregation ATPase